MMERYKETALLLVVHGDVFCLSMEEITYILKGKKEAFDSIWGHFIHFMENEDMSKGLQEAEQRDNV